MTTTEIAVRPPEQEAAYGLIQAEAVFTPERREAIAQFLEIPGEHPALIPYLAVCARYGLDPIMGQVWLIPQKVRGRDGSGDKERLRPTAGRDGFLAIARRSPEYLGMDGDVVCARDRFRVRKVLGGRQTEGGFSGGMTIEHDYPQLQDVIKEERGTEGFDPATYRGPVLGAYALVHLKGRRPTYYFASIREHGKVGQNSQGQRYWKGAWEYTSAMILKSAQSYALRIALGITGIVPADEIADNPPAPAELVDELDVAVLIPAHLSPSSELAEHFQRAVDAARAVDPNLWNGPKLEMYLSGVESPEELEELARRIAAETEAEEKRLADLEEYHASLPGEVVADAEEVTEIPPEELERLSHEAADLEARLDEELTEEERQVATVRLAEIREVIG